MLSFVKKTFLITVSLGIFFTAAPAMALDDAIIAIVNEDIVTLKDLRDYIGSIQRQMIAEGRSREEITATMADLEENGIFQIIDDKIVLDEAKERGLEVREELIDKKVDEVREKYVSEKEFIEALVADGATLGDFRNKIEEQLMVRYFIDLEVRSKIIVNPQDITDFYQKHPDHFLRPARVNLESIFLPFDNDPVYARQRARNALNRIRAGENFADIAKEYSATPFMGIVSKGQMVPEIDTAAFRLQVDEISDLIESDEGIFILKLKGKLPQDKVPLEQAKKEIYNILFAQKFKERYQEWIDNLREQAYVEIK